MLNRMLQNKAPIIYGDGKQKRCFSYIDDCLSCLIPMKDQSNLNKQIINIGPDEEFVTINKVAEICSNITGSNFKPIYKPDRPKRSSMRLVLQKRQEDYLIIKLQSILKQVYQKTFEYIKKEEEQNHLIITLTSKFERAYTVYLDKKRNII